MSDQRPLRISEITRRIKGLLTRDPNLQDIWIQGEVSSFTVARSGHIYYSLKDREAQITCVMWSSSARRQRWLPEEGDEVRAYGKVDVYARVATINSFPPNWSRKDVALSTRNSRD